MSEIEKRKRRRAPGDGPAKESKGILSTAVGEGMFRIPVNPEPAFRSGGPEGNLYIDYIKADQPLCRAALGSDGTGGLLPETGGIAPGRRNRRAKLGRRRKEGTSPVTAKFIMTDPRKLKGIRSPAASEAIAVQD